MNLNTTSPHRSAFTIIEAVMSVLIVGGLFAAVLNTVGASRVTHRLTADTARAALLAQDLLSEIVILPYDDDLLPGTIGAELGELTRLLYDDVDDYHSWSATPPQASDGTAIAGCNGWTRSVYVAWASPVNPALDAFSDSGLKRITVTVSRAGIPLGQATTLRAAAGDSAH